MLSTRHNFLFIHIPKTGGNSIQKVLVEFSEDRIEVVSPRQDGSERFGIRSPLAGIHKHSSLADYKGRIAAHSFAGLVKFCSIRNPWDRCISHFFSPHRGPVRWSDEEFERFVHHAVHPAQHYLQVQDGKPDPFDNVDAILRFEDLAADFARLCERLGLGRVELPRLNASTRGDYRDYYRSRRLVDLVASKFAAEIERFGYTF